MMAKAKRTWLDGLAMGASGLCLLHCLALPLLVALLPGLLPGLADAEWVHLALLAFAIPVSASALAGGWRAHRGAAIVAVGAGGLALMATGALLVSSETAETALTGAGSLVLAAAHLANWRARAPGQTAAAR